MSLLQMERDRKPEKTRKPNLTGIPSYMKQDFEARSGLSYDDVRIHYSSPKPAELGALAYTQGSHVYIGPGQERHLPHELVHVAQQKRGEVRPTGRLGNLPVNEDPGLERQADGGIVVQSAQAPSGPASHLVQRKIGMEYQTVGKDTNVFLHTGPGMEQNPDHGNILCVTPDGIEVTADGKDLEYVTPAVNTPEEAFKAGCRAAEVHETLLGNGYPKIKPSAHFIDGRVLIDDKGKAYTLQPVGLNAHPQATVGIRMNKITDLLLELGGTESGPVNEDSSGTVPLGLTSSMLRDTKEEIKREGMGLLARQKKTMRDAPKYADQALTMYENRYNKKAKDRASILGLLSLLIAYNAQYDIIAQHPSAAANAKNAMPVMNRTSLYDAYLKLKVNDRKIFLGVMQREIAIKSRKRWSATTFQYNDPLSKKTKNVDEIVLAGQVGYDKGSEVWDILTLDDWVNALAVGGDAMYHRFHSVGSLADPRGIESEPENESGKIKRETLGKFNIDHSTDIGIKGAAGLLVELRGLERAVPCDRWGEIAWRVANLVNCLNNGKKPNKGQLPNFGRMRNT